MDEKTTRIIRFRVYISFAVAAAVMAFVLPANTPRIIMAVLAVYCLGVAFYNLRKAKECDKRK